MDREKRRSEEEEKELDRRIALIREKNQQIEQRTKEIEEDRARNGDSTVKSPKSSSQTPPKATTPDRNGNGQWSREWDKGKTPAETWRENVPSMDLKGRLAGQNNKDSQNNNNNHGGGGGEKGGRRSGGSGGRGGNGNGQGSQKGHKEVKIPSRLEGRVTFPDRDGHAKEGGRRGGKEPRGGERQKNEDRKKSVTTPDGEPKAGQRRRSGGAQKDPAHQNQQTKGEKKEKRVQPAGGDSEERPPQQQQQKREKKNRPRRESDNFAVRKVVHRMVDKVCWMERMEKRKAKAELLGEQVEPEPEPEPEEPEHDEQEEKSDDEVVAEEPDASEAVPEAESSDPKVGEKQVEKEEEEEVKEVKEDSNQNVISLVKEKVVVMTTSELA